MRVWFHAINIIDPQDIEKLNEERRGEQPPDEGNEKEQYPFDSDNDSENEGEYEQNVEEVQNNAKVMNKKKLRRNPRQ